MFSAAYRRDRYHYRLAVKLLRLTNPRYALT